MADKFSKILTKNDCGFTGSHQSGLHISKKEVSLLEALPKLDPSRKNPDIELHCIDKKFGKFVFRYVHYNNRLHTKNGTRDEYRITKITEYLKLTCAIPGDVLSISKIESTDKFYLEITKGAKKIFESNPTVKLIGWKQYRGIS